MRLADTTPSQTNYATWPQTTETSLKLASEDRMAMEKYLLELGEKCQHTHDQLEETKCVALAD